MIDASVIIPTFRRKEELERAIDSVLAQTFTHFEILVIDDGTMDLTRAALAKFNDPRIQLLSNTHSKGAAGARNTGLLQAKGEFIAFLDSDDAYRPNHLTESLQALKANPDFSLAFGRAAYQQGGKEVPYMGPSMTHKVGLIQPQTTVKDVVLFHKNLFEFIIDQGCFFNLSSVVMHRRVVDEGCLMDEKVWVSDDLEYWLRISRKHLFLFLSNVQIDYHIGNDNISVGDDFKRKEYCFKNGIQVWKLAQAYEGVTQEQRRSMRRHLADDYFDHAYEIKSMGHRSRALYYYLKSFQNHPRLKALASAAKVFLSRSRPSP